MKVAELLDLRRRNWQELERLCDEVQTLRKSELNPAVISRFATLYRAACADLALADAYQLPPNTVRYLHQLVARAHNQLYRSRPFEPAAWMELLFEQVPRRIFSDRCVQLAFLLFWGVFILSAVLASRKDLWPDYAEQVLTPSMIHQLEQNFDEPLTGRAYELNLIMAAGYIQHNTSIGLKCFAGGLLIIPGLFVTMFNAGFLGAAFGYMARPEVSAGENFFQFVTAHGPFELTAVVLSAGAGLRLGVSLLITHGFTRVDSLRKTANEAMPIMAAAMILFFLAAFTEAFISPSSLPYVIKAIWAIASSTGLMFYFVVLGFPRRRVRANG